MKRLNIIPIIYIGEIKDFPQDEQDIIFSARRAIKNSHSPYSKFEVGCGVKLNYGAIVSGANQENAAYPSGLCAERTTIFSVFNMGHKHDIEKIAVTAKPAGIENYVGENPVGPCGGCRQVMKEAEDLAGKPLIILLDCFNDSKIIRVEGVSLSLLPLSFGPKDLGINLL